MWPWGPVTDLNFPWLALVFVGTIKEYETRGAREKIYGHGCFLTRRHSPLLKEVLRERNFGASLFLHLILDGDWKAFFRVQSCCHSPKLTSHRTLWFSLCSLSWNLYHPPKSMLYYQMCAENVVRDESALPRAGKGMANPQGPKRSWRYLRGVPAWPSDWGRSFTAGKFQKALLPGWLALLWSASACSGATEKTFKYFYVNRFFRWTTTHRKTCSQTKCGTRSMGWVERSYLCLISRGWWRMAGADADAAGLLNFGRLNGRASFLSPRLCQGRQEHLLESLSWRKKGR